MVHIGIDNGLDGGIVVLDASGAVLRKAVMPVLGNEKNGKREYDVASIVRLLNDWVEHKPTVLLERAQAMPKQGVSSTFSIGKGYGIWIGVLTAMHLPFEIVGPRDWQKVMFAGIDHSDTKRASAVVCSRLASREDWRATERSKIPHSGLTDAYCIAMYSLRKQKPS